MKILHTSDWHLGHRLLEQSQHEEQSLFLTWLLEYMDANQVDVLLVAGDIFDVGVPSAQAQKLYYDFLTALRTTACSEVIITGGNHDAPSTLNAPKALLNAFSVRVVGKATENVADEIFKIDKGNESILVAAIPFLRDQDIRRAIAAETAEEINNRYKTALISHFAEVAAYCESLKSTHTQVIAMGHLFALGGKTSESEQSIYVGNLGDIGADDFPATFDYVALGHLHRAQQVGGKVHIRYSGSPCVLSFSEVGQNKKVMLIDVSDTLTISEITLPEFRKIVQIEGSVEHCKTQLLLLDRETKEQSAADILIPWVEIILTNASEATTGFKEINQFATNLEPEVLKITVKETRNYNTIHSLMEQVQGLRAYTPEEVFRLKCEEMEVDLTEKPELLDAFHEIYQLSTYTQE
ncbi:MAG: exonuclease sbcCD subunit D [Porphyromonadaceae bacterium CG2_30_38_12]|nr:MAG: exonuclease sbcCD subunit D [Porphyromonadaceae bacterium CG2_30_38_12]